MKLKYKICALMFFVIFITNNLFSQNMDTLNGKFGQYNSINIFNADTIYKISPFDENLKLDIPYCQYLDSILATNKKYIIGKLYQDSLIVEVKSKIPEKIISEAFKILNLDLNNCFYLIYNCKIVKKKHKLYFDIIELRKDVLNGLLIGYGLTSCPNFYKRCNLAIFKIRKGKIVFENWLIE